MSLALLENSYEIEEFNGDDHHFWICDGPLFSTTLFCIPPRDLDKGAFKTVLRFFDPDGYLFNEANVDFSSNQVGVLELSQFMESCKLESGIKHGHLFVMSEPGAAFSIRAGINGSAAILSHPFLLSSAHTPCLPIVFAPNKRTFISVVNHTATTSKFKCRLIAGKRAPETVISVPPLGATVINMEVEFPEFFSREKSTQAYLRLSSVSETCLGVTCFEETRLEGGTNTYVGIC
ncbi:MAG: hypothetical protein R3A13_04665 [Bdellovibrionota bacterium]